MVAEAVTEASMVAFVEAIIVVDTEAVMVGHTVGVSSKVLKEAFIHLHSRMCPGTLQIVGKVYVQEVSI